MFLNKIGQTLNEVIGKFCYEITHHRSDICQPPNDPCPIIKIRETGKPSVESHTHRDKANNSFRVNVVAAPIMENGICLAYLHIAMPLKDTANHINEMTAALHRAEDVLQVINLYQKQLGEIKTKASELEKTKLELDKKVADLEHFNRLCVGRELRMVELKNRITELEKSHVTR